ncbi:armadillo repeat-containing protein 2 isoform X4 [Danaus plexippus]|uniref:armadillo repeat-containing protein 2 isoform X4 n=1 Tax=Danaus plexippus TaxID=13037 RepID=UPI002AAF5958|nr:armadillo repeat-containing protein 2 isoform X4 [Danaus plexippus]
MMGERIKRVGAPFYAPPRKTSAEIISEARAAITAADMSGASGLGLRPLRTRRPFTPREPQRTLLSDTRRVDTRPTSGFDLKYQTVQESSEDAFMNYQVSEQEHVSNGVPFGENQQQRKKTLKSTKSIKGADAWSGFPKLPHLSGKSKPLHRRNTIGQNDVCSTDSSSRSKTLGEKSVSYDEGTLGEVSVRHLDVQLLVTSEDCHNMTALEISEALTQKNQSVDRVLFLLDALQKTVEETSPGDSLRELVLRALLSRTRDDSERVLVKVARVMLTMRVTGAYLTAASKLVFKIASNDKNDSVFKNGNLLELIVESCARACPLSESSSVLHAMGALRVLALEPSLAARSRTAGALHLAVLHLKIINNAKAERPRQVTEETTHALYQLTGALRNLAGSGWQEREGEEERSGEGDAGREFASSGAIGELINALTLHTDRDVLTNVARCLSVLSSWQSCLNALCSCPGASRALLTALGACAARAALAVRLAYTLGNMAAHCDQARIDIYSEKGSIDVLLTILESYTQRNDNDTRDHDNDPDLHLIGSDLGGSDGSNEDVLIKTVRVVANLCLTEETGRGLVEHADRTVRAMLSCLEVAARVGGKELTDAERRSSEERREELATAALATINNITFYFEPTDSTHFDTLDHLVKVTCGWLSHGGLPTHEAVRALGNLTRCDRAARAAVLYGALDALPSLHAHDDEEVRSASAGVLVNVCGVSVGGGVQEAGGAAARALAAAARMKDVRSGALLARAVWNALEQRPLDLHNARMAAAALATFIEDESLFAMCEAAKCEERRASDPDIMKNHSVKLGLEGRGYHREHVESKFSLSVEEDLHLEEEFEEEGERWSGSDLGFEEGSPEPCSCGRCARGSSWRALADVALPLLQRLLPARRDAAVGTD